MRLRPEQIEGHCQQGLLPVYLVFGDEQMLVEECSGVIRQQARKLGASDRQVWHVEGRFNWSELQWQEQTMSLFASQRLLEIRLPSGAPGKDGGEALRKYAANPPPDTTLILINGKIDTRSQKEYTGEDLRAARGGHIPGAVNINWILNLKSDGSKTFALEEEMVELYDSQKILKDKTIVTLCQTGVRGTHTYFVLKLLGYSKVRVYDGSWAEWGNDWEAPIIKETIDSPK